MCYRETTFQLLLKQSEKRAKCDSKINLFIFVSKINLYIPVCKICYDTFQHLWFLLSYKSRDIIINFILVLPGRDPMIASEIMESLQTHKTQVSHFTYKWKSVIILTEITIKDTIYMSRYWCS